MPATLRGDLPILDVLFVVPSDNKSHSKQTVCTAGVSPAKTGIPARGLPARRWRYKSRGMKLDTPVLDEAGKFMRVRAGLDAPVWVGSWCKPSSTGSQTMHF